ncbi:hypothetical protein HMPREF9406_2642 [Clostridium sp. HGF2]|nr:hypothetical protein HMPREF9406_2642 [Clostridium sp. HGF2]
MLPSAIQEKNENTRLKPSALVHVSAPLTMSNKRKPEPIL